MIAIAIIAHFALARNFFNAAEFIVSVQSDVKTFEYYPNTDQGVIILTDLFGGVPSNIAIATAIYPNVEVIAGLNLPMLI